MSSITLSDAIFRLKSSRTNFFTPQTLNTVLGYHNPASLHKALHRLEKSNIIVRLSNGKYYFGPNHPRDFSVANFLIQPSYVSLETALNLYGILSQFPYPITSITTHRSKTLSTLDREHEYLHISPKLFWGFIKTDDYLIASPEKSVIDIFYLASKGLRSTNVDEWDWSIINKQKLLAYSQQIDNIVFKGYFQTHIPHDFLV